MNHRRKLVVPLFLAAVVAVVIVVLTDALPGRSSEPSRAGHLPTAPTVTKAPPTSTPGSLCPCPYLAAGSDPSVLPGPILIADHLNNRLLVVDPNGTVAWTFPRPGNLAPGETFTVPDDAFLTPDGKYVVVTEEDDFVISLVSIAHHKIVWRYGSPGQSGSGPNRLWNPDDAMMMPDGDIIAADIKNCRLLILRPGSQEPVRDYGTTGSGCWHQPPGAWGSPNGAFPMADGDYLVTEINGDWVDELTLGGRIRFSTHAPGVSYPSDTNEVRPGVYLTVDYSNPGQIVEFDQHGRALWRYAAGLNHPSLALPLPNGDILCNDDYNHRVIVVDPRTNRIVWQYGHTGVQGSERGYLNEPDGVDLMPPNSLAITHAAAMGEYPSPPGASPVPGQARARFSTKPKPTEPRP